MTLSIQLCEKSRPMNLISALGNSSSSLKCDLAQDEGGRYDVMLVVGGKENEHQN